MSSAVSSTPSRPLSQELLDHIEYYQAATMLFPHALEHRSKLLGLLEETNQKILTTSDIKRLSDPLQSTLRDLYEKVTRVAEVMLNSRSVSPIDGMQAPSTGRFAAELCHFAKDFKGATAAVFCYHPPEGSSFSEYILYSRELAHHALIKTAIEKENDPSLVVDADGKISQEAFLKCTYSTLRAGVRVPSIVLEEEKSQEPKTENHSST